MSRQHHTIRQLLSWAPFIVAAALAFGASPLQAKKGGQLPPFELPAAVGGPTSEPFRVADHLGKEPIVILFWATWCVPCRQELPFYESLHKKYEGQGLNVVAISMDSQDTVMTAGPAARRLGISYDVVTDVDTRVTSQLNPRKAAPFSIWVNAKGKIVWEREGFSPAEQGVIANGVAKLVKGKL